MAIPLLPVVHLDQGSLREQPREPAASFLAALARRHAEAVLVDVQGLAANRPDVETLQRAARNRSVWVDAGSRTVADVSDLFVAGASRVTARWNTLTDSAELEEAAEMTEGLYVGVEVGLDFVRNPRDRIPVEKLAELVGRFALPVVVIDLAPRAGPSSQALSIGALFASSPERWFMGIASPADAALLEERGYAGAILPHDNIRDLGADPE